MVAIPEAIIDMRIRLCVSAHHVHDKQNVDPAERKDKKMLEGGDLQRRRRSLIDVVNQICRFLAAGKSNRDWPVR
jgi:hypothetical protein